MSAYLNHDGNLVNAGDPVIRAGNRGFRYGDGLFETMKVKAGTILHAPLHFDRLLAGIKTLAFDLPPYLSADFLKQEILRLCRHNGCEEAARVRLTVFRGDGSLYDLTDNSPHFIIEATPVADEMFSFNKEGCRIGIYKEARKSIDNFSNLKTNNYLCYVMAAFHAKENRWNDSLLMNSEGNVCESTIANVFTIKDGAIFTPSLEQGCVAGVMRRHILSVLRTSGYNVRECSLTLEMIMDADEMFLSNAITGVRWVADCDGKKYVNKHAEVIYHATSG